MGFLRMQSSLQYILKVRHQIKWYYSYVLLFNVMCIDRVCTHLGPDSWVPLYLFGMGMSSLSLFYHYIHICAVHKVTGLIGLIVEGESLNFTYLSLCLFLWVSVFKAIGMVWAGLAWEKSIDFAGRPEMECYAMQTLEYNTRRGNTVLRGESFGRSTHEVNDFSNAWQSESPHPFCFPF